MPPDPNNLPPVDPNEQVPDQLVHTLPPLPPEVVNDLLRRFTYHRPNVDQAQRYELITAEARDLAVLICQLCPDSRERSTAITLLTQVRMMANASIACNE